MENGLMNSHMMGFTDVRGLNILEDAIAKHPNETYKNIDIQKIIIIMTLNLIRVSMDKIMV